MKKQKSGLGGLYVMIVICLIVSGVAIYGLMGRLQVYQESNDTYADLQNAALTIKDENTTDAPMPNAGGATQAPAVSGASSASQPGTVPSNGQPAAAGPTDVYIAPDGVAPVVTEEPEIEPEGEIVEDEAFVWMLKNQTSEDELITDLPRATPAPTPAPTATPERTAAPAAAETDGKVTAEPEKEPTPVPTEAPTATPSPTPTVAAYIPKSGISMERAVTVTTARYSVDFDYLTLINEEVTGWIYQEGTPINYPILRGKNNEYYLNHLFDGTVNSSGSIFMDSGNSIAFIDSATYVYGHHTKDGSMFASLSKYLDPAYYDEHPQMLLLTPFADYQVDLFAGLTTLVDDESSWRLKDLETEEEFLGFVSDICSQSSFQAKAESMPEWGDRLLVLVTCTNVEHGQRYVIYGRMRPIVYESTEENITVAKQAMDQKPTNNGYVEIDGIGRFMYYSQTDELWKKMRYEASGTGKRRTFGESGCGPTAVAMGIANLCPVDELPRLIGYANTAVGFTFCDCSVNRYYCNHTHAQYQLRTGEEFLRYMPIAIGNFATGNNIWTIKSRGVGTGTNMRFLEKMGALYGIRVSVIEEEEELFKRLNDDDGIKRMVICCAANGSPFTKSGHYVLLAGWDDTYVYVLDPLPRDSYEKYDRNHYAEILQPGVVRIAIENLGDCHMKPYYLLEKVQ